MTPNVFWLHLDQNKKVPRSSGPLFVLYCRGGGSDHYNLTTSPSNVFFVSECTGVTNDTLQSLTKVLIPYEAKIIKYTSHITANSTFFKYPYSLTWWKPRYLMKQLAVSIAKIIKDYRNDSNIFPDSKHVLKWVDQFETRDREFMLNELLHILPESYINKKDAIQTFTDVLKQLSDEFGYTATKDFLSHVSFINRQQNHKSQREILNFVELSLKDKHSLSLKRCGRKEVRYWLYFDDVLASGATFRRDIKSAIDEYGVDRFKNEGIRIVAVFLFVHEWGRANTKFILLKEFDRTVSNRIVYYRVHSIDNDPRINSYNPNPKFNHAYPVKVAKYESQWNAYLESLDADDHANFAFRNQKYPAKESFYTSAKNRIRFETILLNSGLNILSKADNLSRPIRPLGLVSPGYQTFGTGSHTFTWRNISNTCPIVIGGITMVGIHYFRFKIEVNSNVDSCP